MATLGQLTATVSHELRNPLGTIQSSLYALEEILQDKDLIMTQILERMDRSIIRCDNIINELLDFTRVTPLNMESTNLHKWLTDLLDEHMIPANIKLDKDFQVDQDLPFDQDRLRCEVSWLDCSRLGSSCL